MTWARSFMAVPTSGLRVDSDIAADSPKGYTDRELKEMAATVPAIYDRMNEGWGPQDFQAARASGDPAARQMGETYHHLFDAGAPDPLRADLQNGELFVSTGNHRIRAAQDVGVPVVPAWVYAPTEADLQRVDQACATRIEQEGATQYRQAHLAHEAARAPQEQTPGHSRITHEHSDSGPEAGGFERAGGSPEGGGRASPSPERSR